MYVNLKEIYDDYPDDYDKICVLLDKRMAGNAKERADAKLSLEEYGV